MSSQPDGTIASATSNGLLFRGAPFAVRENGVTDDGLQSSVPGGVYDGDDLLDVRRVGPVRMPWLCGAAAM